MRNGVIGTYSGEDYSELITARTNQESIKYLEKMIPSKNIKSINIKKSNTDVFENVLHLDCCFQPIGERKALICPDSFVDKSDVDYLISYFGEKNTYIAYGQEAYMLISNILVISPEVIVFWISIEISSPTDIPLGGILKDLGANV